MNQSFLKFFYFLFYFLLTIAFEFSFRFIISYAFFLFQFSIFVPHADILSFLQMKASWKRRLFILFSLINFLPFAILIWIIIITKVIPATINWCETCIKAEFLSFQKFSQLANRSVQKAGGSFIPPSVFQTTGLECKSQ